MTKEDQLELFQYDLTFIKFLRGSVRKGELRELGPKAVSVLMCLRALAPIQGVSAHPSRETVMELTGIGRNGVTESIKVLKQRKYVEVVKIGRKNVYKLLEKVHLESTEPEKREDQIAMIPYGATETRKHFKALAGYARTGELDKSSPIIINNLDLTINYAATGASAVFINAKELDQIPQGQYRDAVERILGLVPGAIGDAAEAQKQIELKAEDDE